MSLILELHQSVLLNLSSECLLVVTAPVGACMRSMVALEISVTRHRDHITVVFDLKVSASPLGPDEGQ